MYIDSNLGQGTGSIFPDYEVIDPVEAARLMETEAGEDMIAISDEARKALQEAEQKRLVRHALSLPDIQARIETVRAEIAAVWDSALPDEEKYSLISSKENEIALLQAGQFDFARNGFSLMA